MNYGYFGTDTTIQERAQAGWDDLEREFAPPPKGIAWPLSYGAKGIEVGVLQQALIDLGYLAPTYGAQGKSSVDNDFGKMTGKALEAFLGAAGIPCQQSSSSKGCKTLTQIGAQALDSALAAQGTSPQAVIAEAQKQAPEVLSCTQALPAWKAVAIGAGLMANPCPPPGQDTQATAADQQKAKESACAIYKKELGPKIMLTGGLGIISGALLGAMFADDKKNGMLMGGFALGLLAGGAVIAIKPGKPQGC